LCTTATAWASHGGSPHPGLPSMSCNGRHIVGFVKAHLLLTSFRNVSVHCLYAKDAHIFDLCIISIYDKVWRKERKALRCDHLVLDATCVSVTGTKQLR
jgi:hypothetical protein